MLTLHAVAAAASLASTAPVLVADTHLPPFDFSNEFYIRNGIDPTRIIGRPTGAGPNSIIDNRENGPDLGNIRLLRHTAAYDHSGHPVFFTVTGLPSLASFLPNAAGREALEIAERSNVYEFPRATNPQFAVFPKRQDLIADLRNGYFSNDPLGTWRINLVRYTPAATDTAAGRDALARLAARNGRDLDGTPLIRTLSDIDGLRSRGLVTIDVPHMDGSGGFRWFFCPILQDPRNGAIAPDAHLEAVDIPAAAEFRRQFACLQSGGDWCSSSGASGHSSDCDHDGLRGIGDVFAYLNWYFASDAAADFDDSGAVGVSDLLRFLDSWFAA